VVRVPDLDRGSLAPRNILAVVVDVISAGFYLLGTKEGLLERPHTRNEFTAADNLIEDHDNALKFTITSVSPIGNVWT